MIIYHYYPTHILFIFLHNHLEIFSINCLVTVSGSDSSREEEEGNQYMYIPSMHAFHVRFT